MLVRTTLRQTLSSLVLPLLEFWLRQCLSLPSVWPCSEKNVSGVVLGQHQDNLPCAKQLQLLLYGMHCNWTYSRPQVGAAAPARAFHLCSGTCQQTFDLCADVNTMVRAVDRNHGNSSSAAEAFCAGTGGPIAFVSAQQTCS
eukprot:SAG22_NODE_1585_length_4059_cov_2.587121_2_plen_142_part_00